MIHNVTHSASDKSAAICRDMKLMRAFTLQYFRHTESGLRYISKISFFEYLHSNCTARKASIILLNNVRGSGLSNLKPAL